MYAVGEQGKRHSPVLLGSEDYSPVNLVLIRELRHVHPLRQVKIQKQHRAAQRAKGAAREHLAEGIVLR